MGFGVTAMGYPKSFLTLIDALLFVRRARARKTKKKRHALIIVVEEGEILAVGRQLLPRCYGFIYLGVSKYEYKRDERHTMTRNELDKFDDNRRLVAAKEWIPSKTATEPRVSRILSRSLLPRFKISSTFVSLSRSIAAIRPTYSTRQRHRD